MFVNPLNARDKFSLGNRNNLMEPIQMQLSEKQEFLSNFFFFFSFLKATLNFKSFSKREDPHS